MRQNVRRRILRGLLLLALPLMGAPLVGDSPACAAGTCCKVCKKGKACGNSCIAAHLRCTKPAGCACNG